MAHYTKDKDKKNSINTQDIFLIHADYLSSH